MQSPPNAVQNTLSAAKAAAQRTDAVFATTATEQQAK